MNAEIELDKAMQAFLTGNIVGEKEWLTASCGKIAFAELKDLHARLLKSSGMSIEEWPLRLHGAWITYGETLADEQIVIAKRTERQERLSRAYYT